MTPRTIGWRTVGAKLRRIRELLDQLQAFGPVDADRLKAEPVTALAIERILTLVVGMRNVLVHDYRETDRDLVAAAVPLAVAQYGEYVQQVARFVQARAT